MSKFYIFSLSNMFLTQLATSV